MNEFLTAIEQHWVTCIILYIALVGLLEVVGAAIEKARK